MMSVPMAVGSVVMLVLLAACGGGTPVAEVAPAVVDEKRDEAILFAPGVISTGLAERDGALAPDGSEFYFTATFGRRGTILLARRTGAGWTGPEVVPFSGEWSDIEPALHGNRLYFASLRPLPGDSEPASAADIWFVERSGDGWGEPSPIGPPINTDADEFFPSFTSGGTMYFTRGTQGGERIYRARPDGDGGFAEPELLPAEVNAFRTQYNACIAPDESYLIFATVPPDGLGGSDYVVSFRNPDGSWARPVNAGAPLNSKAHEWAATVSPDGSTVFFHSTRSAIDVRSDPPLRYADLRAMLNEPGHGNSDIYRVSAAVIERLRPTTPARADSMEP
jgi:hypothetical protein